MKTINSDDLLNRICKLCSNTELDIEIVPTIVNIITDMQEDEPNRVLTYEELSRTYMGFMWMDIRGEAYGTPGYIDTSLIYYERDADPRYDFASINETETAYNKSVRCWLRKPTDEERAHTNWYDWRDKGND